MKGFSTQLSKLIPSRAPNLAEQLLLVDVIKPASRLLDIAMLEPGKRFDFYSRQASRSPGRMREQRSSIDLIM